MGTDADRALRKKHIGEEYVGHLKWRFSDLAAKDKHGMSRLPDRQRI